MSPSFSHSTTTSGLLWGFGVEAMLGEGGNNNNQLGFVKELACHNGGIMVGRWWSDLRKKVIFKVI